MLPAIYNCTKLQHCNHEEPWSANHISLFEDGQANILDRIKSGRCIPAKHSSVKSESPYDRFTAPQGRTAPRNGPNIA